LPLKKKQSDYGQLKQPTKSRFARLYTVKFIVVIIV